jgi:hypothetical protein
MKIAGHFELTVRLAGISRLFPVAGLRPARSLREQGTQSWQLDAVTIDQGLRHGGHNGVYGFLSGLLVYVVRFGQIGNEGGFGDGGHGVPQRIFRFLPQNIGDTGAKRNVGA